MSVSGVAFKGLPCRNGVLMTQMQSCRMRGGGGEDGARQCKTFSLCALHFLMVLYLQRICSTFVIAGDG